MFHMIPSSSIDHMIMFPVAPATYMDELFDGVGKIYLGDLFGKEGMWFLTRVRVDPGKPCVCTFTSPQVADFPNMDGRRLKDHIFLDEVFDPVQQIDLSDIPWISLATPDKG